MADNNNVVSQKDISAIVGSMLANTNAVSKIIDASVKAVLAVSAKVDKDVSDKPMKKISKMMSSYNDMVKEILNVMKEPLDEGKTLDSILGRIQEVDSETYDGDKITQEKVTKFTGIECMLQVSKIIESTVGLIGKIGNFEGGFKTFWNFHKNIYLMKYMISSLFTDLIKMFKDILNEADVDTLLKTLVKQPDKIKKTDTSKKTGENQIDYNIVEETETGQLGLLDIFEKTFGIVGMINNLQVPNFIKLEINMFKTRLALRRVINGLTNFVNKNVTDAKTVAIEKLSDIILGKSQGTSGKREGGINGVMTALLQIFSFSKKLSLYLPQYIILRLALRRLGKIIDKISELLKGSIGEIVGESNVKLLNDAGRVINALKKLIIDVAIVGLVSIAILPLSPIIAGAIWSLGLIFRTILWLIERIEKKFSALKDKEDVFAPLSKIIHSLMMIMLKISVIALLAVPASIALFVAIIPFLFLVGVFVVITLVMSELIEQVSNKARNNLDSINLLILSLMMVGLAIVFFALLTPLFAWLIKDNILPFMLFLAVSLAVLYVVLKLTSKLTDNAKIDAIKVAINVLLIVGSLILCAVTILILGLLSKPFIDEPWMILGVLGMIGGIVLVSAAVTGLGNALAAAAPLIAIAIATMGSLLALLAITMSCAITLNVMSKTELKPGKYKDGDPTKGNIGSGEGIIGNIGMVIGAVKFISFKIGTVNKSDIKNMRKAKRLMKQVNKTTKQIVNIAERLDDLNNIKLNKDRIIKNVGALFAFVVELETQLDTFMTPKSLKTNDAANESVSVNNFTAAIVNRRKRRQMRKANRTLNKVEKVIHTINNIGEALCSLNEMKMDGKFKQTITGNVDNMFKFINELESHIALFMIKDKNPEDIVDAQKMTKKEWKRANRKLSKVESTIATIHGICDALNTIKDLKFNENTQATIRNNVELAIGSIESIASIISGKAGTIKIDEDDIEKLTPLVEYISALNDGFKDMGTANAANVEKNINNYIKFVDKVNTMDVEKVQKTTQMFEKMSEFSSSIQGDFDRLAEALSDKLLPVLEELKSIMTDIPDKLDKGFQNTSASIGAANSAPTSENVAAQVQRENPNLTKEEVDKIVRRRINERAKADANGLASKLDEIAAILKGYRGTVPVTIR